MFKNSWILFTAMQKFFYTIPQRYFNKWKILALLNTKLIVQISEMINGNGRVIQMWQS